MVPLDPEHSQNIKKSRAIKAEVVREIKLIKRHLGHTKRFLKLVFYTTSLLCLEVDGISKS